ncbi:hypothetical protein HUU05_26305 [candidate division KSB1 bacterium]|nr:hypothetical protein [candidate division KSB1 bacterium]
MKPIWYFVGLMLLGMGSIILFTGLYLFFFEAKTHTVFAELHPNIWWGAVMVIAGGVFFFYNRKPNE